MSLTPADLDAEMYATAGPDPQGQAALLLAESILHALVEGKLLSNAEAIAVVAAASEVKIEVALDGGETKERVAKSLSLLAAIAKSFAVDAG